MRFASHLSWSKVASATAASLIIALVTGCSPSGGAELSQNEAQVSNEELREFRLKATMLGFIGIGGEIDEAKNPALIANEGERVRITIVNGELMVHDIALELHGVASKQILQEGEIASIEFVAEKDDTYYCTVPGHRASMSGSFRIAAPPVIGVLPEKDGRPLNLDFENGDLRDWTAKGGTAFEGQPIKGDSVKARRGDQESDHAGEYWIGTYEVGGDSARGTLTSETFRINHPWAAFHVGGGANFGTRVELMLAESNEAILRISGLNQENMRPVVVDLRPHEGKEMFLRIVDHDIGHWGHINFDEFLFYAKRPMFPDERDPREDLDSALPPLDEVPFAGLSGEEAAAAMTAPEGFSVRLAASEPDIVRPIAMTLDDRGRVWVVEGRTYPNRAPEGEGRDRILIFEDTTGDGKLDSRKVFMENLNLVSGIELGFGGVWLGAAPYLLYVPLAEDGESPGGEPQILLDGWGFQDTHETLNGFTWGPDGWLYGCHGVFTHSNVGKPGAPESERQPINAGIWRYHPVEHRFEIVAHGTSNPWGLDFDAHGEAFATVCVIPHLHHVIPGARYHRQGGQHFNPHTYDDIKTMADHVHWMGDQGPHRGNRRSDAAGGGHAHAGAMIYQGGSWPEEYHGRLFMNNIHGYRSNTDILQRHGSGYTARHGPDFIRTNDSWSQILNFRYGPGGSIYMIDWYDKNQCHSTNPDVHDKTLGRIFHVSHENDQWEKVNLATKSSAELVEFQLHDNDWYVRHARRLLAERGPDADVHAGLRDILQNNNDVARQLRALWALNVTGGMDDTALITLLDHQEESVRAWAVRLLVDNFDPSEAALSKFATMAGEDSSALLRLYLASALQRLKTENRWDVLRGLVQRDEDAGDANIPLMLWYALEPLVPEDPERALALALDAKQPNILPFTLRRIHSLGSETAQAVIGKAAGEANNPEQQATLQESLATLEK